MTRTRQTAVKSSQHTALKTPISEQKHVPIIPIQIKKKKANTPYSFARERMKLCKKDNVFWRLPFKRLINEITVDLFGEEEEFQFRWQQSAIDGIQEAAEEYLLELFEDANTFANHAGRPTILPKDLNAALYLYDKRKNKALRPETIHEKEVKQHAQKLKLKKERNSSRVAIKKEQQKAEDDAAGPMTDESPIIVKPAAPKTPRKPRKKSEVPQLAPASDNNNDEVDPNDL